MPEPGRTQHLPETQESSDSTDTGAVRNPSEQPDKKLRPKEVGGPEGPEPTRYGDWERKGRCIDF